jgi:hypothetical protein
VDIYSTDVGTYNYTKASTKTWRETLLINDEKQEMA